MGGRWWIRTLSVVALLTATSYVTGCAPSPSLRAHAPAPWAPTLLVESASVAHVAVRLNGMRVGTITRGRNCIRIPAVSGSLTLDFESLGARATTFESIHLVPGLHWRLELGPSGRLSEDVFSLAPATEACAAVRREPAPPS